MLRTWQVSTLSCAATAASICGFLAPFIAPPSQEPTIVVREASHFSLEEALLHDLDSSSPRYCPAARWIRAPWEASPCARSLQKGIPSCARGGTWLVCPNSATNN
ncbi:hypothetical protein GCM10023166_08580 [Paeniglutamicibacter cryotolerans]